ncbi:arylesterase [Litoribrevibacter euphylliae]|uniref:Arylesterase n=2 Tax=Litoribrevibacter euphylliae TaxID=1834034 RepID=A0ABV7HCY2_9GAMM
MKRNVYFLVILVFSLFSSITLAQGKRILILGDSLSAGYGIEVEQSWPVLLEQRLSDNHPNFILKNVSISGQTSVEGLSQVDSLLKTHQPSLLVLELGANDGLRGLSISEMKNNLAGIIQTANDQNIEVLLLGMRIPTNYGRRYTQMFHNVYLQLAEEYNTHFIPFMLEPILVETQKDQKDSVKKALIQSDGLHPTAKAQPMIMEHIWKTLNPIIQEF